MDQNGNHELAHAGIKNMKWGIRRYQNKDGSLTPLGRKHYGIGPGRKAKEKAAKAEQKAAKAKAKSDAKTKKIIETEEQRKARKEKELEQFEAAKQKALRSGSAADVLKFQGHLTNKELADVYQRLNSEKLIKSMADADAKALAEANRKPTVTEQLKKVKDTAGVVVDLGKKVWEGKELIDKVRNADKEAKRNDWLESLDLDGAISNMSKLSSKERETLFNKFSKTESIEKIKRNAIDRAKTDADNAAKAARTSFLSGLSTSDLISGLGGYSLDDLKTVDSILDYRTKISGRASKTP